MRIPLHMILMAWYAILTASFFALLWRETPRERVRLFLTIALALFTGGILIAVFMHRSAPGL